MKTVKIVVFLAFFAAVAAVLLFTPVGGRFLTTEGRKELVAGIDAAVRAAGPLGPALFVLIYGLGALVLPATPFTAAGAFIFGRFAGTAYNILGVMLGATLAFALGRYFLRDFARGFLVGKLGDLDRKAERHGFTVIFYLRIFWFPFIVLNYAAGATSIRPGDYFFGTLLGTLPSVILASFFFGSLREIAASFRGPADLLQFGILFPAGLLLFSFLLPGIVKRIRKDRGEPGGGGK